MTSGPDDNKAKTKAKNLKERLSIWPSPIQTALSPAYLIKNYALGVTGYDLSSLVATQSSQSMDAFFSPTARAKILKDNVAGIKTSFLNEHIKKANQSIKTNVEDVLTRTTTGFESLKGTLEKLSADGRDTDKEKAAKKLLALTIIEDAAGTGDEDSLYKTRHINSEINEFQLRMEALQEMLESNEVDNPRVITAYVKEQYDKILEQLKLKRTADLNKIAAKMSIIREHPDFTSSEYTELEATLKKDANEAYDKAEKGLDKDFKTGVAPEKKDDKEVNKGTNSLFKDLEEATVKAEAELHNFVLFSEKSKSKSLVESGLHGGLGAGALSNGRIYRDVSFDDYARSQPERDSSYFSLTAWYQYADYLINNSGDLTTPTGLRLKQQSGRISFSFPSGFAFYYHYQDRLLGADMMSMVNEMVRQGAENGIVFELNDCSDPNLRKVLMQEYYYAARLAGLEDDKIFFKISGCPGAKDDEEKKPIDKSAAECMHMLGDAPARAGRKKQQWEQEKNVLDTTANVALNRDVSNLSERIDDKINLNKEAFSSSMVRP